jgi:hypothetical protein
VHSVCNIEPTDQEHDGANGNATVDSAMSPTPPIRQKESRNGRTKYNNCRNTGGEKGGLGRSETGLFEEKRCILRVVLVISARIRHIERPLHREHHQCHLVAAFPS